MSGRDQPAASFDESASTEAVGRGPSGAPDTVGNRASVGGLSSAPSPTSSAAQDQESREFAEAALQAQADAGMWDDDSGIRPGIHAVRALPGYIAMVSRAKKVDRQIGASGSAHGLAREVLTLDAGLAWLVGDSQMDSAAWTRDPTDVAEEFVAHALTGGSWECRDSDGEEPCWVERGVGESGERFIETPLSYFEACKIERLLEVARGEA